MTLNEAYRILGVAHGATAAEVKAAYRRSVAQNHPDKGGDAAEFIRVRAAYEIIVSYLKAGLGDEDVPVPAGLREVIDSIVGDFREHMRWTENETLAHLGRLDRNMQDYVAKATRAELRQFSSTFSASWNATISHLFAQCNDRCDQILQSYESWYSRSTQVVFDRMYLKEVRSFMWRPRFYLYLLILWAVVAVPAFVLGSDGRGLGLWIAVALVIAMAVLAFLLYRRDCRRKRKIRERVEPLSVVPFSLKGDPRFQAEIALRRGRQATAGLGVTGLMLGDAVAVGLGGPAVGAVAGLLLGGVLDRVFNPTRQLRATMGQELAQFMELARIQVPRYVLEVHEQLLDDVRDLIVASYEARVKETVKLLAAG